MAAAIVLVIVILGLGYLAVMVYAMRKTSEIPQWVPWGTTMLQRWAKADPFRRTRRNEADTTPEQPPM